MVHTCESCNEEFERVGNRHFRFCSKRCESKNNRKDRPSDEWLNQKYTIEKVTCPELAKILGKDPKTIYLWIKQAGIPTRSRGVDGKGKPKNYETYWKGKKLPQETKDKIRQAALKDGRVPYLNKDGVHWLKGRKEDASPNYKGGITPERQSFYGTPEWKQIANLVWRRDRGTCQHCGIKKYNEENIPLDIHHIVSFAVKELRMELSNLVLLCEKCHYWVHSKNNTDKEFIKEYE